MDDLFQKELENIVANSSTGMVQSLDENLIAYSQGIKAFNEGDIDSAIPLLTKAANNNANACYALGNIFLNGYRDILKKDINKAIEYFEKAGKLGLDDSYYYLGFIYQKGEIVPQDYNKALSYFMLSDNGDAYFSVGYIYFQGLGVDIDYVKALESFYKAYLRGNPKTLLVLSRMYYEGKGTQKDFEKAFHFAYLASVNESAEGTYVRAFMLERGEGLPANKDQALKYYQLAKEQGFDCQDDIDRLYKELHPVESTLNKLKDFFKK